MCCTYRGQGTMKNWLGVTWCLFLNVSKAQHELRLPFHPSTYTSFCLNSLLGGPVWLMGDSLKVTKAESFSWSGLQKKCIHMGAKQGKRKLHSRPGLWSQNSHELSWTMLFIAFPCLEPSSVSHCTQNEIHFHHHGLQCLRWPGPGLFL